MTTNSAVLKTRLTAISADLDRLSDNLTTLSANLGVSGSAAVSINRAVEQLKAEIQANDDNAWKAALSGITRPGTHQAANAAPAGTPANTGTGAPIPGYANVPAPAVGKPVNLTEEARKLLHTGHSYEGAIKKLVAQNPSRDREHIRRAVGRANGGKA